MLLKTTGPASDRTVAWIGPHLKARVVFIQMGHGEQAHNNANYQRLVPLTSWSAPECQREMPPAGK